MSKLGDNEFKSVEVDGGYWTMCHRPVSARGTSFRQNYNGYLNTSRTKNGRVYQANVHRVRYEAEKGKIPDGLVLDHLCRNKWCSNVNHLEAVSYATNSRRGLAAKLTVEKVIEMRKLHAEGMKQCDLAILFNISKGTVSLAVRGIQWNLGNGLSPAWEIVKQRRAAMN